MCEMNRRLQMQSIWVAGMVLSALGAPAFTQTGGEFEITRSTIDGGGVMRSSGGNFEMSATIGQPDAAAMNGGDFALTGGFWYEIPPTDCNDDGIVGLLDHETFAACLLGPNGGINASPCFDVDRDGDITLDDYAKLQAGFTGQ